jgi:NADH-quinone oxidoreductase subunit L
MLFLGWEMIGLTSFFLINLWVNKVSTLKAAFKAFSFNKVSDFFLLFALMGFYCLTYDVDICSINNQITFFSAFKVKFLNININVLEMLSFLLISCSFIKSAQLGPHIWLPDSMEAPVPASSLIHSATLVSAGVFVILRFYPLFENSTYSFFLLPIIGSATAVYGGVVGAYQADIKRILAYSTISHCGFLIVLTSFNLNEFTIMYLYVHGFFKASVFMCVGNIIRSSKNYQDFRKMGMLYKCLPFEFFTSFVCLFNLAGLPFSLGFYIKHLIFLGFESNIYMYYLVLFNIFCGAISGLFYSYRIFFYAFFDFKKANKATYLNFNRKETFSFYYSNTSILSNFSILGLVITSYVMSFYLLSIFLNKINLVSDFSNFSNFSNFFNTFNSSNSFYLFNLSLINFFVIMFT